jgi:glycosyltransferase involved in cell wall biosynthesis
VIFTNKINYEYIPYFTSAFDAGICHLPDNLIFRYSFPLKILEYLACEIPVLASDIKAHRDILSETGNIYLYNDEMSFIHQIDKIKNDNDKSNITNVDNYDWSVISQKIINQWHMNS